MHVPKFSTFLLLLIPILSLKAKPAWVVNTATVKPTTEYSGTLAVALSDPATKRTREINAAVAMTKIKDSFVHNGRLVITGQGAVEIFNVVTGLKEDWFYCTEPKRVSSDLLAYVKLVPKHSAAALNGVLLVYDLSRSLIENRFGEERKSVIPADGTDSPVNVGVPIFPERNAREKSYDNLADSPSSTEEVLTWAGYLMVDRKLVFVYSRGGPQFSDLTNYVGVADLSHGGENSNFHSIAIPKSSLRNQGDNPNFVELTGMQPDGADAVRLLVPLAEYGVSSIRVNLDGPQAERPATRESAHLVVPAGTKYVRQSEAVEQFNLLTKSAPLTWKGPAAAVRFEVLIGPDGFVRKLLPIEGPAQLVPVAERVARGQTYKPAFLGSERVSVLTTATIEFQGGTAAQ